MSRAFLFPAEPRTTDEHTKQMEKTLTEERCRYQNLLSEHLHLEEQNRDLKEEMYLTNVLKTLWITSASSHLAADCITPFTRGFFFLPYTECEPIRSPKVKLRLQQQLL